MPGEDRDAAPLGSGMMVKYRLINGSDLDPYHDIIILILG